MDRVAQERINHRRVGEGNNGEHCDCCHRVAIYRERAGSSFVLACRAHRSIVAAVALSRTVMRDARYNAFAKHFRKLTEHKIRAAR